MRRRAVPAFARVKKFFRPGAAARLRLFQINAQKSMRRRHRRGGPAVRMGNADAARVRHCADKHLRRAAGQLHNIYLFKYIQRGGRHFRRAVRPRGGQTAEKCIADYILINNPAEPKVFKLSNGSFVELPPTEWSKPLAEGFLYSPFDLLMPYKFWKPAYEGAGRIGQAVHFFRLAPHDSAAAGQNSVRLALSREFSSPVQAQILSSDSRPLKTLKLASVKKIDSRWIMREAELRDESSRDKDILRFESANLRDSLPKSIFDTQSPDMSPQKPDMTKI